MICVWYTDTPSALTPITTAANAVMVSGRSDFQNLFCCSIGFADHAWGGPELRPVNDRGAGIHEGAFAAIANQEGVLLNQKVMATLPNCFPLSK